MGPVLQAGVAHIVRVIMVPAAVHIGDAVARIYAVGREHAFQRDHAVAGKDVGRVTDLHLGESGKVLIGVIGDDVADGIIIIQQCAVLKINDILAQDLCALVFLVVALVEQGHIDPDGWDQQAAFHVGAVVHLTPDVLVLVQHCLNLGRDRLLARCGLRRRGGGCSRGGRRGRGNRGRCGGRRGRGNALAAAKQQGQHQDGDKQEAFFHVSHISFYNILVYNNFFLSYHIFPANAIF